MEPRAQHAAEIEARRTALVNMVASRLSPIALRYGYSDVPLEATIKWRPLVLVLGNYSSGKSTLINEILGCDVQQTGQAPTDDCFTVITGDETTDGPVRVTEEREGTALLAGSEYPFAGLKRHGQRFAAHFRLKKVNTPFLNQLALIDTPGMLDSLAEQGRGYDYQAVVGDLAAIADLVLVLFDPHKAGTIREAHASLRETLPKKTFEDRVLFVLNRVDECDNLPDLLRVYGTLCWNLSQMLGRKDIPPIRLTYSKTRGTTGDGRKTAPYLAHLDNQRDELINHIAQAPRYRLDHLAAFAELHGERVAHFLEALLAYRRARRRHLWRQLATGVVVGAVGGIAAAAALHLYLQTFDPTSALASSIGFGLLCAGLWLGVALPLTSGAMHRGLIRQVDKLTPLVTQSRQDTWHAVRALVQQHLERTNGKFAAADVARELDGVRRVLEHELAEARATLEAAGTRRL